MKTQRSLLVIVIVLLILFIAANILYIWQFGSTRAGEPGVTETNRLAVPVERVKNQAERARMEEFLAEYNAPQKVVKSISVSPKETVDCVETLTQYGAVKNGITENNLQLTPAGLPEIGREVTKSGEVRSPNLLYLLTGDSCPEGTVPVQRLTMTTLARFETLEDFFKKSHGYIQPPCGGDTPSGPHEYAHAWRSVNNWGAESILNVWSPYVEQSYEFSLSQIWVTRGSGANLETVEAGWQVYEDLYGDWRSHLFIYFTPDNYGSGGCYNLSCGAFVQVNGSVYIGSGFTNYSSSGDGFWEFKLMLLKDHTNGDWWLRYGDTWVGYWPRSRFDANGLRDQADSIDFGGEIVNTQTDGRHTRTDMGSGYFPYHGAGIAAYHRNIRYVDTSYFYREATGLSPDTTDNMCYDISLFSGGGWGQYFLFGGSGYNTYCP